MLGQVIQLGYDQILQFLVLAQLALGSCLLNETQNGTLSCRYLLNTSQPQNNYVHCFCSGPLDE